MSGSLLKRAGAPLRTGTGKTGAKPFRLDLTLAMRDVRVRLAGTSGTSASKELFKMSRAITIIAGGIPIVIVVTPKLTASIGLTASVSAPTDLSLSVTIPVTIVCKKVDCSDVRVRTGRTPIVAIKRLSGGKGSIGMSASVKAAVDVKLYDGPGLSVSAGPAVSASCPVGGGPGKVNANFSGNASANLSLLGRTWSQSLGSITAFSYNGQIQC